MYNCWFSQGGDSKQQKTHNPLEHSGSIADSQGQNATTQPKQSHFIKVPVNPPTSIFHDGTVPLLPLKPSIKAFAQTITTLQVHPKVSSSAQPNKVPIKENAEFRGKPGGGEEVSLNSAPFQELGANDKMISQPISTGELQTFFPSGDVNEMETKQPLLIGKLLRFERLEEL